MAQKLLPCPFCGNDEPEFQRLGAHRVSCQVSCGNCGCHHESGDEGEMSERSWNDRAASDEQIRAGIRAYEEVTGERLPDADGEDYRIVKAIIEALQQVIPSINT